MPQADPLPATVAAPNAQAAFGRVISVRGSHADVGLPSVSPFDTEDERVTVGKFIGIRTGKSVLVGVITDVSLQAAGTAGEHGSAPRAHIDIVGEILDLGMPSAHFRRGVTTYPAIGDTAGLIGPGELALVFNRSGPAAIEIGHLQQDASIGAYVNATDMLSKHFAVLGTTGVGKSSGVALILQQMLAARPDLRMFVLDAHNEYGRCFGERALVLNPGNVKLPFWMFNFEEIVDVIFGGRPGLQDEVDILAEIIPLAKVAYTQYRASTDRSTARRIDPRSVGYTVDSPVPYRVADLLSLLDARMGKLENRSLRLTFNRLITRIETVFNDPRNAFMFENANVGGDTMAEVFAHIFRLPPNGMPMTIMQLAGFPAEVVDAVVSVLCRMAFDFALWSDGAAPLLVVCEEAHRYVAADRNAGFGPTRRSISRIAKEGRKYGVFLGLVTQRPAELDPTILSQCSTLLAMRMTNDRDQAILKSAVTDAAANLLAFLPSLGTGEVLAFGEGVALPTRLKFKLLPPHLLPRSEAVKDGRVEFDPAIDRAFVAAVLDRWRSASVGQRTADESPSSRSVVEHELAPTAPTMGLDPERFKLLKKTPAGPL